MLGRRPQPEEVRFWPKVLKTETCWWWLGRLEKGGYGRFTRGTHRSVYAHRLAYEMVIGPIPQGLTLDHLCRHPACVNPSHLEPVTMLENIRRGGSPSARNARKTRCLRGHPYDEGNTMPRRAGGRICRTCEQERHRAFSAKRGLARQLARQTLAGATK